MAKTPTNISTKILDSLSDEIFIVSKDGEILYSNKTADELYGNINNIKEISEYFSFEIAILRSEDLMSYNPITEAINSKENFCANINKQISENSFLEYTIQSYITSDANKIIILKNIFNKIAADTYNDLAKQNQLLESQVITSKDLKIKLENSLARTNLINFLSDKIKDSIEAEKIIKIVLEQLKKNLDITDVIFDKTQIKNQLGTNTQFSTEKQKYELIVPVYFETEYFGQLILTKEGIQNRWPDEEVNLIKSISNIMATALNRANLFKKLKEQKKELENTLTKLKDAQLQIVQTEKMASLGQLVAGVAHEINTPLGAIASNLDLLNKISETDIPINKLKETISDISPINAEGITRIKKLINSLKNFTRLDEAKMKKVDITDGILSTLDLIEHETKNRIIIEKDFAKLPEINCYPDYLNQVFMNIILNACQSIKNNGTIKIKTEYKANYIQIKIQDNGCGIKKDDLQRIFEFGFTTKKIGEGTGLGLALAQKIIQEHQGEIKVESEINKGSLFTINLPVT